MEKDREKMRYAYGIEMPPASEPETPGRARSAPDPYANVEPLPESSRPRRDGPGGEDGEPDTGK